MLHHHLNQQTSREQNTHDLNLIRRRTIWTQMIRDSININWKDIIALQTNNIF
jgi:hypothetical protein